jgi:hypothetical protein
MKKPKVSALEAVKASYPQLAEEAQQLQQVVTDLGASMCGIEVSLRRIGLQVSAWHQIAGGHDEDNGYAWSRDIGYTRIGEQWYIAVREWSEEAGQEPEQSTYKFRDAPPWMVLDAAGKIPELLEELIERTRAMRTKIAARKTEVDQLAAVLNVLAAEAIKSRD